MGWTHHDALSVNTGSNGPQELVVSGSTRLTGTARMGGIVAISGAFTATGSGKLSNVTKLDVAGTVRALGAFIQTGGKNHRVGSAANGMCGLRKINAGSAGSASIATTKVQGSSRIFLMPIAYDTTQNIGGRIVAANVQTVATGVSFKIRLFRCQTAGTIVTASGRVAWQIINL